MAVYVTEISFMITRLYMFSLYNTAESLVTTCVQTTMKTIVSNYNETGACVHNCKGLPTLSTEVR